MKKLRIALTFLLVLCCSVCLFACKKTGDNGGAKNVSEMSITGGKRSFKENEAFSAGDDLTVKVYYQGDDNEYELTPEDYEIDSSAYNETKAGTYNIYIIPKNQPENLWDGQEGSPDNRFKKSYPVSVDHSWVEGEPGKYTCQCGAVRNSYPELDDKFKFVGWGNVGEYTRGAEGKTYPDAKAPIAGENHISYGSLVAGQSLELVLKLSALNRPTSLVYNESTGGINGVEMYDTPLMGFRNGAVGFIPREDNYVIGTAAGFVAAAGSNIPSGNGTPTAGTATTESNLWDFYGDGSIINASTDFVDSTLEKWSTVVVTYDYQSDGIMRICHELYRFKDYDPDVEPDARRTFTVKVPDAAYEVVVYGENCSFTITSAEFIAGRALKEGGLTIENGPDAVYQPAGKLFDTTGLKTRAEFTDGGVIEDSYNAYAYRDITPAATDEVPHPEAVKTKINLSTDVLTADMYDFCVEFNGQTAWLTANKQESTEANKAENQTITVVPNVIIGATTTPIKDGELTYDAPAVEYDYAVTESHTYIRLVATGTATKATAAQSEKLGGSTHFIAFKLLTNLAADGIADTLSATGTNIFVIAKKVGTTVDVIVGVKGDYAKTFDLTLKDETKIQIDLGGLEALPAVGAEITESDFYLDIGGTYTVKYSGFSGSVADLKLSIGSKTETVANIKEAIKGEYAEGVTPDRDTFFRGNDSQYIVGIDDTDGLTVTYWIAAPQIGNLTVNQIAPEVTLRDADNKVLASATLTYRLLVKSATNIGTEDEPVCVVPSDNRLIVYAVKESENLANGLGFAATLNIEHEYTQGKPYDVAYNVGVTVANGAAAWAGKNALTQASTAKVIPFGTMNNATDYDTGAILIANLSLTALGVRDGDSTQTFHFTANENTEEGQEAYTIYTVSYDEEKETDKITSAAADLSKSRTELQKLGCITDGIQAYRTDGGFWFGAIITPATGAHTFVANEGSDTMEHCTVCNYTREKIAFEGGYDKVVLEYEGTSLEIKDGDGGNWWADPTEAIEISGNFAVEFKWENTDGNYTGNAALEFFDADNNFFAMRTFVCDYNPGPETSKLFLNKTEPTHVYTIDGEAKTATDLPKDGAAAGNATVLVWRVGNTLYVRQILVYGEHTLQVMSTITDFTSGALFLRLNGNTYWCSNVTYKLGNAEHYLEAGEGKALYEHKTTDAVFDAWYELPNLPVGYTMKLTGKHQGEMLQNWHALVWEVRTAFTGRADNFGWSFDKELFGHYPNPNPDGPAGLSGTVTTQPTTEGDEIWTLFREVAADCDFELTFSLATPGMFIVDLTFTNGTKTYKSHFDLEFTSGAAPATGLDIHLTGEACSYQVETLSIVK